MSKVQNYYAHKKGKKLKFFNTSSISIDVYLDRAINIASIVDVDLG